MADCFSKLTPSVAWRLHVPQDLETLNITKTKALPRVTLNIMTVSLALFTTFLGPVHTYPNNF